MVDIFRLIILFLFFSPLLSAQVIQRQTLYTLDQTDGGVNFTVAGQSYGPYQGVEGVPAFSADLKHWVAILRKTDGYEVLVDGRSAMTMEKINGISDVSISEDGILWSVVAGTQNTTRQNGVRYVNGKALEPFGNIGPLVVSPTGSHWYYVGESARGQLIIVDGKAWGPYQNLAWPAWDVSGNKLAFTFARNGSSYLWTDGKETGPYQSVQLITRSDGAWIGATTTDKNNMFTLLLGGKILGPYTWVDPNLDWKSPDGSKWMTRAYKKGVSYLVDNGKEIKLDSLDFHGLPGGSWVARYGGWNNWSLNIDGQVFGPYDAPYLKNFDDGSDWAFGYGTLPADQTEKYFVRLKNGETYPGAHLNLVGNGKNQAFTWFTDEVQDPLVFQTFDRTGYRKQTLAEVIPAEQDGVLLKAGGVTYGPYASLVQWTASPDGKHWAAVVQLADSRFQVVIDGHEQPPTQVLWHVEELQISDNGSSWALRVWPKEGSDEQLRITNGIVTGPYRQADWTVKFSADGSHAAFPAMTPKGETVFQFDGKIYGPFASAGENTLLDMDAGHFAMGIRAKSGVTVVTDQGSLGPYQNWGVLTKINLIRDAETGPLLGFQGQKADGSWQLYLYPGIPGGGKLYGPYKGNGHVEQAFVTPDGQDWWFVVQKPGESNQTLLHNGQETPVKGARLASLGENASVAARLWVEDGQTLILGGNILGTWTFVEQWLVARDGSSWAAQVQQGNGQSARRFLMLNGTETEGTDLKLIGPPGHRIIQWFTGTPGGGIRSTMAFGEVAP